MGGLVASDGSASLLVLIGVVGAMQFHAVMHGVVIAEFNRLEAL